MSLRRENATSARFNGTSSMRHPRTFTPPQQRAHQVTRRCSLGQLPHSAEKKPSSKRSNSVGGGSDECSPTKLDFQSLKKRPSLLGNRLKSGSKESDAVSSGCEKQSIVMLGAGGVGKTGKSLYSDTVIYVP